MKITLNWLEDFIDLNGIDLDDLSEKLGSQGLEVEEIIEPGKKIKDVYIGLITKIEDHPNADKLKICHVDIGKDEKLQLVTGASNVKEKVFVPVAVDGAKLNEHDIKKVKLRGKISEGMICSLEELGLEEKSEGIYIMENVSRKDIGKSVHPYLGLDDKVIDFEITSNRSDCLSVLGIAREISIATGRKIKLPETTFESTAKKSNEKLKVNIKDYKKCYNYTARFIENISLNKTPLWMKTRLELVGLRSINIVVDITNYVMWEIGLPLHAFDSKLVENNKIIIREANNGEDFKTLTGEEICLNSSNLVIADTKKSIALAGVVGGLNTEINEKTDKVILEAALFDPVNIRATAKEHNLSTDSSYRFERGMDYNIVRVASDRASFLLSKYADASVYQGVCEDKNSDFNPHSDVLLRWDRAEKLLGFEIPKEDVIQKFVSLDYDVIQKDNESVKLRVPSYRYWDVKREVDLIEETVRLIGYHNIPMTLPRIKIKNVEVDKQEYFKEEIFKFLQSYGFFETKTFPFISEKEIEELALDKNRLVRIKNPMTKDFEYMTCEPLVSLLKIAELNKKRSNEKIKIYEWGKKYLKKEGESFVTSILLTGKISKTIYKDNREMDFFDLKPILDGLIEMLDLTGYRWEKSNRKIWSDDSSYYLVKNNLKILEYGKIDPDYTEKFDFEEEVWGAYIFVDDSLEFYEIKRKFREFSSYPPIYYDLAFIVDKNITAGEIKNLIEEKAGNYLEDLNIFDIYEGEHLGKDKRSIAFSLIFRSKEKTLQEDDINANIKAVIESVKEEFGAKLRE